MGQDRSRGEEETETAEKEEEKGRIQEGARCGSITLLTETMEVICNVDGSRSMIEHDDRP